MNSNRSKLKKPAQIKAAFEQAVRDYRAGDLNSAEVGFQRVVAAAPGSAMAAHNLGLMRLLLDRPADAVEPLRAAIRQKPDFIDAIFNLATALQMLAEYSESEILCKRVIAQQPGHAGAWNTLGIVFDATDQLEPARDAWHKARALAPGFLEPLKNLAQMELRTRNFDAAHKLHNEWLAIDTGDVSALRGRALAGRQLGRLDEAIIDFESLNRFDPEDTDTLFNLAMVFQDAGKHHHAIAVLETLSGLVADDVAALNALSVSLDATAQGVKAETILRQAIRVDDSNPRSWNNLGNALATQERMPEAAQAYRRSIELDGEFAGAHNNLGLALAAQSERDAAQDAYQRALRIRPQFGEAFRNLVAASKFDDCEDPLTTQMLSTWQDPGLHESDRMHLGFALGKTLDDCGDYDRAFKYYTEGNELRDTKGNYDPDRFAGHVSRIISTFDDSYFKSTQRHYEGNEAAPLFIIGMPRSGTTLVEQILDSHPAVFGAGELTLINQLIGQLEDRDEEAGDGPGPYPECVLDLSVPAREQLAAGYLNHRPQPDKAGVTLITDKLPFNFAHAGLLWTLFPRARFIHCRRDLRDVALSNYFQFFPQGVDYASNLNHIGRYARDYQRLMDHWQATLPGLVLDVVYEDLVADPETITRAMIDYLGLAWDDACLHFFESRRAVRTASIWQIREPVYKRSLARWQRYESHLAPFTRGLAGQTP